MSMLSHKLLLDDEEEYHLLAIHSTLEDYKIAFFLNKLLHLNLKRARCDVDFNHGDVLALYPLYVYKEPAKYLSVYLIKNKYKGTIKKLVRPDSLFTEEEFSPTITFFIPEHKEVDYFLKIEGDLESGAIKRWLEKIALIPNIITTFSVDPNQLKSKNNLILD
jgi:hypothetical protein